MPISRRCGSRRAGRSTSRRTSTRRWTCCRPGSRRQLSPSSPLSATSMPISRAPRSSTIRAPRRLAHALRALALLEELDDLPGLASAIRVTGDAYRALGRLDESASRTAARARAGGADRQRRGDRRLSHQPRPRRARARGSRRSDRVQPQGGRGVRTHRPRLGPRNRVLQSRLGADAGR